MTEMPNGDTIETWLETALDNLKTERAENARLRAIVDRVPKRAEEYWKIADARIAELEAIVDKLPKTEDGVPVWPGMKVWSYEGRDIGRRTGAVYQHGFGVVPYDNKLHDGTEYTQDCWSTREAAEAAEREQE